MESTLQRLRAVCAATARLLFSIQSLSWLMASIQIRCWRRQRRCWRRRQRRSGCLT